MEDFIKKIPKAELHMHFEGAMSADLLVDLASKNNIPLDQTVEQVRKRRENYTDLPAFVKEYAMASSVLKDPEDFYRLAKDYFRECAADGVVYTETFFASVNHLDKPIEGIMSSLLRASSEALEEYGIEAKWILNIVRHRSLEENLQGLAQIAPYKEHFVGIGLAGAEVGFPASNFIPLFDQARQLGWDKFTAHAGEEGGPEYVIDALYACRVNRIDHGVQALHSPELLEFLKNLQIPLTVCPISNKKLKVNERFLQGRLVVKELMDAGILFSIHSDDPAFFAGNITDNFLEVLDCLGNSQEEQQRNIVELCKNSFKSSFISSSRAEEYCKRIDEYYYNFINS